MEIGSFRIVSALLTFVLIFTARAQADPTAEARVLLEWCIHHKDNCSISIDYERAGETWHIDVNGTRLNVLASSYKVIDLIAYADAVDSGTIVPGAAVSRDDWTRFWMGQDGGALAAAYARFSKNLPTPPLTVTNDQIVSAMIQESDNAAPDYLLNKLGAAFFTRIVERYMTRESPGYMDVPLSLNANFVSWTGGPLDSHLGRHALNNYSGYETDGYRGELDALFVAMHDPAVMTAIRGYAGSQLPWIAGQAPPAHAIELTEAQLERLDKDYSMRSNTRTMTKLMLGLLHKDLLSPNAQRIVQGFLEYRLVPPVIPLLNGIVRYGTKDGAFTAFDNGTTVDGVTVRTRTAYAEQQDGTKVAFTVQLTGTPGTATDLGFQNDAQGSIDSAIRNFAVAMVNDVTFAFEVHRDLGLTKDALAPSLVARIVENRSTADHVRLGVAVKNIGTAPTDKELTVGLYSSDDGKRQGNELDRARFPSLRVGEARLVELDSHNSNLSKFLVLDVDPTNEIPAVQKQNNPQFEIIPGH